MGERKVALVGEAKWTRRERADRLTADMARKVAEVRLPTAEEVRYVVCTRKGVDRVSGGVIAVTAGDIFG